MKLHMYLLHIAYVFGVYEIAVNPKYNCYQRVLASMMCKIFHKKIESGVNVNEVLPQELHNPVIKRFKRRKVYYTWGADLVERESLSSKNRVVKYLLCQVFSLICMG